MERWYFLVRRVLASAWRQRWLLVVTAWGVCLLGWVATYAIPDTFESDARIYVDTDAILTPLLHGLAINTETASQLEIMQKTLLSRPNLDKLISSTDLNLSVTSLGQRQQLVLQLGRDIKVTSEGHNLFTVAYRNKSPKLAHDVVAGLVNIFMERATGSNQSDMANAQRFLHQQIASYQAQLRAADQRRAAFRRKYIDILPLAINGGVSQLDIARGTVSELEARLQDTMAQRAALQEEARLTPQALSAGAGGGSAGSALAAAEAKLTELRARFTDQNPDVIIARQLVAALKAAAKREPALASHPPPRGGFPNAVYEQLKMQLIRIDATISALRARLDTAQKDLARMEKLARAAPQVEAKYEDLNRGYDVLRKNYDELIARREMSNITAAADIGADKVRLRVIDPPQIPRVPVAPNRLLLVSLVLLAGMGAATGLAIVLSQTDQSIAHAGELRNLGFPVIGGVSLVRLPARPRLQLQSFPIGASIVLLILIYAGIAGHIIAQQKALF